SSRLRSACSSRSQARRVETYSVSPPRAGMTRADSTEASAGTRLKVLSGCQSWFALLRSASRGSAGAEVAVLAGARGEKRGGGAREVGAGAERSHLGHFERPEPTREGELRFVGHLLAAKDNDRVLLEGRPRFFICGLVGRDPGQRDAAQLGGKARTQRDDLHRRASVAWDA